MANKIEIFENTLLKLLIRRGLDADRQNVVLTEGELGYTTDTKKLFVGDGQTSGGIPVGGNKFLGSVANVTTLYNADIGDLAYSTTTFKLYQFTGGDYSDINDWSVIGGVYYSTDGTVIINANNGVSVGTISAANLTTDIAGNSITLSNTNKITLSSQIAVDTIKGLNSSYINFPGTLNINSIAYSWPEGGIAANSYLQSDISGNLSWSPSISIASTNFVYTSSGIIPVGSIMPFISSANAPSGWLLCNGQSVAGSAYPELSAVIGTTFGGTSTNFNVPNLINKTLYGVSNSPGSSTLYRVSSGTNSSLSATGALYIIKAKPDGIINVSMSVNSPLCASVNGIQQGGSFNPLSGNISIGLPETFSDVSTTFLGGFEADAYGRVTNAVTISAGTTNIQGPGTRPVYNGSCSPIGFFQTPAVILSNTNNVTFTISAYPFLTNSAGLCAGSPNLYSVPPNAKNLIVDTLVSKYGPNGGNTLRLITSAPQAGLLNGSDFSVGTTEYLIGAGQAAGKGDAVVNSQQSIIPLSAKSTGDLTVAFRVNNSNEDSYNIRVIGYTL